MVIRRGSKMPFTPAIGTKKVKKMGRMETFSREALERDLRDNSFNPRVGQVLASETNTVRVWMLHLQPGERVGFHRHVLDYFWISHTPGRARSHHEDGSFVERNYLPGDVVHHHYGSGEYKLHDLINIGDTELIFTTVEFLNSANPPLPVSGDAGG